MKSILKLIALSALCALSSCSSGGGDDDDGDGDTGSFTGVRIIHGGLDGSPLAILINGTGKGDANFASAGKYQRLPEGSPAVSLVRSASSGPVLLTVEGEIDPRKKQSVIVITKGGFDSFRGALVIDEPEDLDPGLSAIRIVNGVNGSGSMNVRIGAEPVSDIDLGTASDYVVVTPGAILIEARRSSDGELLYSGTETFDADRSYTMLITGEAGYFVVGKKINN